jgi:hypothetical protein
VLQYLAAFYPIQLLQAALKKPCIHICSTSLEKLPFDVLQWKTTKYNASQTHKLGKELAQRLKEALA